MYVMMCVVMMYVVVMCVWGDVCCNDVYVVMQIIRIRIRVRNWDYRIIEQTTYYCFCGRRIVLVDLW